MHVVGLDVTVHDVKPVQAADLPALQARLVSRHMSVALFGGGHVGRALIDVLGNLPCAVTWIDSRDEIFPEGLPAHVAAEHSAPVEAAGPDFINAVVEIVTELSAPALLGALQALATSW